MTKTKIDKKSLVKYRLDLSLLRPKTARLFGAMLLVIVLSIPASSFAQDTPTTPPATAAPVTPPTPAPTQPVDDIDQDLPGVTVPPDSPASRQETIAQEKARTANKTLDEATSKLLNAQLAVDATSLEIQQTRSTLADLQDKIERNEILIEIRRMPLEQLARIIKRRAVSLYQDAGGNSSEIEDKLFTQKKNTLSFSAQRTNVKELRTYQFRQSALEAIESQLKTQRIQAKAKEKELNDLSVVFEGQLATAKVQYEKNATKFLDAFGLVGARLAVEGKMCPIAGPLTHVQDWGNPRSGGRRHKGNDIFNAQGTPNVAIVDGTIRQSNSPLGGMGVSLSGIDGNVYYYAHLSAFAGGPRAVKQGEVIGYTGDTGNARGGAPHTHLEIRVGGTQHVDPYPTVRIICGAF